MVYHAYKRGAKIILMFGFTTMHIWMRYFVMFYANILLGIPFSFNGTYFTKYSNYNWGPVMTTTIHFIKGSVQYPESPKNFTGISKCTSFIWAKCMRRLYDWA